MREDAFQKVTDLMGLANKIKVDIPYSCTVYNSILLHHRNHCSYFEFFTLKYYPDAHVVLGRSKDGQRPDNMLELFVYCRETEVVLVMEALGTTCLLDWSRDFIFYYLPDHLLQHVQGLITDRDGQKSVIKLSPNNVYVHTPTQADVKCQEDVSVRILGKAGVHQMVSTWRYHKNAVAEPYLKLAKDGLALGVYAAPGTPVYNLDINKLSCAGDAELALAWGTLKHWGDVGLLMTHEQHRRRGLGSLILEATAKLAENYGYIAHACAQDYNKISKNLMEKLGWKFTHRGTCLFRECET